MKAKSRGVRVIGRSMEPALFEGDLVELSPVPWDDLRPGECYGVSQPGYLNPVLHRLERLQGQQAVFRGDRQPCSEAIQAETAEKLERLLDRSFPPRTERLLFSLLRYLAGAIPELSRRNLTHAWDWEDLISLSARHQLLPSLLYVLQRSGLLREAPQPIQQRARATLHNECVRSAAIDSCIEALLSLVPEGSLLKGARLRSRLYPETWLRSMSDVDLLAPHGRFRETVWLLQENGFSISQDALEILGFYHQVSLKHEQSGIAVDVHETLFQPFRYSFADDENPGGWNPPTEFVYLCAHTVCHWGMHGSGLLDLYLLWQKLDESERAAVFEAARCRGAKLATLFCLKMLHEWMNIELPAAPAGFLHLEQKARLALATTFHADRMRDDLFGRRKHLLQLLIWDRLDGFWKFAREPSRLKMLKV